MMLTNAIEVKSEELRYIIKSVKAVKIYYVWTGRNAWWSVWSTRYSKGCMHLSLKSAKDYCEKLRTQGTVFYIDQLPSIAFIATKRTLFVSEINTEKFFERLKTQKLKDLINIIPVSTMTLHQISLIFNSYSLLWSENYPKDNSCILSFANFSDGFEEIQQNEELISYGSSSSGPNFYLKWTERKFAKDSTLLHQILLMLKSKMLDFNESLSHIKSNRMITISIKSKSV